MMSSRTLLFLRSMWQYLLWWRWSADLEGGWGTLWSRAWLWCWAASIGLLTLWAAGYLLSRL